jgi:hypothetical protein
LAKAGSARAGSARAGQVRAGMARPREGGLPPSTHTKRNTARRLPPKGDGKRRVRFSQPQSACSFTSVRSVTASER